METFVTIKKHDRRFEQVYWTLLARGRDTNRPSLTYLCVASDYICCTDGHRIHKVQLIDILPEGFYMVLKCTKSEISLVKAIDTNYPDVDLIIRDLNGGDQIGEYTTADKLLYAYHRLEINRPDNAYTLSLKYLAESISDETIFRASIVKISWPITIYYDNRLAIIMPIQLGNLLKN